MDPLAGLDPLAKRGIRATLDLLDAMGPLAGLDRVDRQAKRDILALQGVMDLLA